MSVLLSAHQLTKAFGAHTLFQDLTLTIETGERIGLIGPNGMGKSTLLKILAGISEADQGSISRQRGLRIGTVEQIPVFAPEATVFSAVREKCAGLNDWDREASCRKYLGKLSLDGEQGVGPEMHIATLSGGWKKRVALARELVGEPDLLFLDEPTNHLDVESIQWLEELLSKAPFATVTVTHDRFFLQKVSNRILELDRRNPGGLLSVSGDYSRYLETKEMLMASQERQENTLRNTLRRETEWLRRGPKARTTKQQARIQRAEALGTVVATLESRNQSRTVGVDFQTSALLPKRLIEAKSVGKSYDGRVLFEGLTLTVTPKSRIGILGPNGCGKSTLIRVLVGQEAPDQGHVRQADRLKVAYFEQDRETLNPAWTLAQAISPQGGPVEFRGATLHIRSYLDRFLFSPKQMDLKVGQLSGGEQSRLLIAKLMLSPANLLVLDEPTNDLDLPTLRILEESLQEFDGAILLVTHDRYFMDQIATQILAFPSRMSMEQGQVVAFADLAQWQHHTARDLKAGCSPRQIRSKEQGQEKKKLSYLEQREFDAMEEKIHTAEGKLADLTAACAAPENATNAPLLLDLTRHMDQLKAEIEALYARWAALEIKISQ